MNEKAKQLIEAVKQMRKLQKEFFNPATRRHSTMYEAKAKEKEVDKLLQDIEAPAVQPSIFDCDRLH